MSRDISYRQGNRTKNGITYDASFKEIEFPIKLLLNGHHDGYEVCDIPGLPSLDPGNFPYNIEKIFWSYQGEIDYEDWYMIGLNKDGNFIFFKCQSEYTFFLYRTYIKLYVCEKYEDLINYALDEKEYKIYIEQTYPMYKENVKNLKKIEEIKIKGNKKGERLFLSEYLSHLPERNFSNKLKNIFEYSIDFRKYEKWGKEFLNFYIQEHSYVYKLKLKDEKIVKNKKDRKLRFSIKDCDGYEDENEGVLINYRKGFKVKIKYVLKFDFNRLTIEEFDSQLEY